MITAESIKSNQSRMESARSGYDRQWSDIARLVYPELDAFYGGNIAAWSRFNNAKKVEAHDPYAAQALEDGVSLFEGYVMPRGQRWQKLALDDDLMKSVRVAQWVEQVEQRLFRLRHDPESGFVGAVHESAMSLYAFAAQSMWIDIRRSPQTGRKVGISYESEFVGEIYVEWDGAGNVRRIHRKFGLTGEQALAKWGRRTPESIRRAVKDEKRPDSTFEFIHVIEPNEQFDPERMDENGKPWASAYYLCGDDHEVFERGGYRTLPRIFSTFTRGLRNSWGFSPTMRVLPQIKLLQEIDRDRAYAAELSLLKPLLATDDELDGAILDLSPLGVTYGGLDERGNPRLRSFFDNSDAIDAEKLAIKAMQAIDKAYGRDLLQITREQKTHISATRTQQEMAEQGILLAPLARQESTWLAPMTVRELALMGELGELDDMPDEVVEYFEAEGAFNWRYDNQLSRMMKSQDTAAFLSLAEQVGVLANFDKSVIDDFKREYPMARVLPVLGANAGVPAAMRATDEEKASFDAEREAKQQQEAMATMLPGVSDAIRNVSAAGAMANGN